MSSQKEGDSLAQKIVRQIEYYFGDINISKDKFMQEETQKDAGWVSLETLIKFNRLKQLSTDYQVIIDALKSSTTGLLEINEDEKKVRRTKALPENLNDFEASLKQNTVYVKGFPTTLSLDELIGFFEKFGKVLTVFMRRFQASKQFKGSVFVTFETSEQMKSFLELPEPVQYGEVNLIRESQEDYTKRKAPEIEKYKESRNKKDQEKEDKQKKRTEAEEAYLKEKQVPGAVLFMKGLNGEGTRENIKELFDTFAKVQWIDYSKGEPEAYVRFVEANIAKVALDKAIENQGEEKTLKLRGATLEARVLEGDEEVEYWKRSLRKQAEGRNAKNKQRNNSYNNKRHHNKNQYKRKNSDDDDEQENNHSENSKANKKTKIEEAGETAAV